MCGLFNVGTSATVMLAMLDMVVCFRDFFCN